jgi:cytochrome c oxidase subunit 2
VAKTRPKGLFHVDAIGTWTLLAAAGDTSQNVSICSPASPSTQSIVDLGILGCAVIALIFVIVEGVLLYTCWRFRKPPGEQTAEPAQVYGSQPIEVAWTAAPAMVVFFLVLVTTRTLWETSGTPPSPHPGDDALYVTVVGRQWWWEYNYQSYDGRQLNFTTANELHMPVSEDGTPRPVYLALKSADVCHSYWVPRLAGKVDLIPGRTNWITLQTNEPGLFLGQCAEYCGDQHAKMLIRVNVDSPGDFDRWLEHQAQPSVDDPATRDGKQAFLTQSCINCHRIRDTPARGNYAPDLTHLMSREMLASGILPNTPENLAAWIRDPQALKVGCLMPAFGLSTRDQDLIVQYLLTLH